jgi:hypothetical protein
MSSGLDCRIVEAAPSQWWYELDNAAYGPFPTEERASEHLLDYHQNPGGWSVQPYTAGFVPDANLAIRMEWAKERTWPPLR